jgi:hypothetical protein
MEVKLILKNRQGKRLVSGGPLDGSYTEKTEMNIGLPIDDDNMAIYLFSEEMNSYEFLFVAPKDKVVI